MGSFKGECNNFKGISRGNGQKSPGIISHWDNIPWEIIKFPIGGPAHGIGLSAWSVYIRKFNSHFRPFLDLEAKGMRKHCIFEHFFQFVKQIQPKV